MSNRKHCQDYTQLSCNISKKEKNNKKLKKEVTIDILTWLIIAAIFLSLYAFILWDMGYLNKEVIQHLLQAF